MPDLKGLVATQGSNTSVSVPTLTISVQVVDSNTGVVLRDFTGANAIHFPAVLATLSAAEWAALLAYLQPWLIARALGNPLPGS